MPERAGIGRYKSSLHLMRSLTSTSVQNIAVGVACQWLVKPALGVLVATTLVPALRLPQAISTGLILVRACLCCCYPAAPIPHALNCNPAHTFWSVVRTITAAVLVHGAGVVRVRGAAGVVRDVPGAPRAGAAVHRARGAVDGDGRGGDAAAGAGAAGGAAARRRGGHGGQHLPDRGRAGHRRCVIVFASLKTVAMTAIVSPSP